MGAIDDPLGLQREADAILEGAAAELRRLLREAAQALSPFPPFPGALFTEAIEVEADVAARRDLGCVVVGPDGELYELIIGLEMPGLFSYDLASLRREELRPLNLPPKDYIPFAYDAIAKIARLLQERRGR